jgi:uncharacterized membrane protein
MYRNEFHEGGFGREGGALGVIVLLVLLALVVVGAVLVFRALRGRPVLAGAGAALGLGAGAAGTMHHAHDPALAELRLRYARGEVTRDEYLQRVADLSGTVPPAPPTPPAPPAPPMAPPASPPASPPPVGG